MVILLSGEINQTEELSLFKNFPLSILQINGEMLVKICTILFNDYNETWFYY